MFGASMRAADTNVLVRLLARDDPRQLAAAEAFVADGPVWISHVVLVEAVWVLGSVFAVRPRQLAEALQRLLDHASLSLQDADVVAAALALFRRRPAVGFSDCLVLEIARKAGHLPLATFDHALSRVDGSQRL
jgi:predicted nucleic-acid-binding protein